MSRCATRREERRRAAPAARRREPRVHDTSVTAVTPGVMSGFDLRLAARLHGMRGSKKPFSRSRENLPWRQ